MIASQSPSLSREALVAALRAGASLVERYREPINALNVFPVPDGDTGNNLALTLQGVVRALDQAGDAGLPEVVAATTRAALLDASGNSGVIFSQWLSGFVRRLALRADCCGPADMVEALSEARRQAYRAVSNPVEGTMLTVARGAAEAAAEAPFRGGTATLADALRCAVAGARRALAATPTLLPVLRDAGVVDAGGQGLVVFLEGVLRSFQGKDIADVEIEGLSREKAGEAVFGRVDASFLAGTEHEIYGYCTQFILQGDRVDPASVRERVAALGRSTDVVGEPGIVRVHVHVEDPGPVLSYAASQGVISKVRMDHMDTQHRAFMARHVRTPSPTQVAVVAVAWGDGFARVFDSLHCSVVPAGRTMNPSARQLLEAARATRAAHVIILPNNPNVIAAAGQAALLAADGSSPTDAAVLHVVPAKTLPQGVAAAVAFNPEATVEANLAAMERATSGVRTVEVTTAVHDSTVDAMPVKAGQAMALLDGRLAALAPDPASALEAAVRKVGPASLSLITLYPGAEVSHAQADGVERRLRLLGPQLEVETVPGGQPLYPYIASLE